MVVGLYVPRAILIHIWLMGIIAKNDYPSGLLGNIALVSRGACPYVQKTKLAAQAGAFGIVIYNNVNGSLGGGLGAADPDLIPTIGISREDGLSLIDGIKSAAKTAELEVSITEAPTCVPL